MRTIFVLLPTQVALISLTIAISRTYDLAEPCDRPNIVCRLENMALERIASGVNLSIPIVRDAGADSVQECVCRSSNPLYEGLHFLYLHGASRVEFQRTCRGLYPRRRADSCRDLPSLKRKPGSAQVCSPKRRRRH